MPSDEVVSLVVGEWLQKAENDLQAATCLLRLEVHPPLDVVCFHSQQCIEKYLKALLVSEHMRFPRIHSIASLCEILSGTLSVDLSRQQKMLMTTYATVARYPGMYDPIGLREARSAVAMARKVRRQVRRLLPREAKRRK